MVFTFLISLTNNVLTTALIRSLYGFVIVFAITYVIRWMLGTLAGINTYSEQENNNSTEGESTGTSIDLLTPEDLGSLNDLLKSQLMSTDAERSFSPLQPPKLVSKEKLDSESLANSLRQLSED
ncbi:MAG: hypothetical protein WD424_03765 [Paenibacillaceae bacterium]